MRRLPKWLRIGLIAIGGIGLVLFAIGAILHKSRPEGKAGPEADALAQKMLQTVGTTAWDSTGAISWNFGGVNQHLWDRQRHLARVTWGKNEVFVNLSSKEGVAFVGGARVEGKKKDKLVDKAWKSWVNDSFWLNPVVKAFDDGTTRYLVEVEEPGLQGLMVSYSSGGATPGDSYLWLLDEQCLPVAWQMWVSVLPIGGIKVPWDGWQTLPTGAQVASDHGFLQLTDIQAGNNLAELMPGEDPFAVLEP
ncbi:MAG: hypothetical protein AAF399_30845 [Bacteroidota bacterium]